MIYLVEKLFPGVCPIKLKIFKNYKKYDFSLIWLFINKKILTCITNHCKITENGVKLSRIDTRWF